MEQMIRIGTGYDIHAFAEGRALKLGGYAVPDVTRGLKGHSDADAVVHAVIDAILGALGLGDIGEWFPDTDSAWENASGAQLMECVLRDPRVREWRIVNIDTTIIAQRPRLTPHKAAIRESLARLAELPVESVSVKAKTNEGFDAVGVGDALIAQAVVLMERKTCG